MKTLSEKKGTAGASGAKPFFSGHSRFSGSTRKLSEKKVKNNNGDPPLYTRDGKLGSSPYVTTEKLYTWNELLSLRMGEQLYGVKKPLLTAEKVKLALSYYEIFKAQFTADVIKFISYELKGISIGSEIND